MMETSATSVAMSYDRALAAIHALNYSDGDATALLRRASHLVRYKIAMAPEVSAILAAYVAHLERQGYDPARVDPDDDASAIALAAEIVARSRGRNDTPICDRCMPLVGNKAPYYRDPAKAPECVLAADPRYCACPKCGTMYRTPIHHLLGVMLHGRENA